MCVCVNVKVVEVHLLRLQEIELHRRILNVSEGPGRQTSAPWAAGLCWPRVSPVACWSPWNKRWLVGGLGARDGYKAQFNDSRPCDGGLPTPTYPNCKGLDSLDRCKRLGNTSPEQLELQTRCIVYIYCLTQKLVSEAGLGTAESIPIWAYRLIDNLFI